MVSTSAVALSGMSAAGLGMQVSAHNIANLGTEGFRRQQTVQTPLTAGGVGVSFRAAAQSGPAPEADMVALLTAKNSFLANLAVFKTGDRVFGALLDAVG